MVVGSPGSGAGMRESEVGERRKVASGTACRHLGQNPTGESQETV